MQSSLPRKQPDRLHVALIMDGNGRWAARRGLPREAGHHAGVAALREVITAAPAAGIGTLTVYAFSSDNWRRPRSEVDALMRLFRGFLDSELARLAAAGVRLLVIGRRDRLPEGLAATIAHAEKVTAGGEALLLRLAIDYSARDAILAAAAAAPTGALTREAISQALSGSAATGDVDLVVRTSGEQRLSDFMLWEAAYAELHFTEVLWPDFGAEELTLAIEAFRSRDRRFGGLPTSAPHHAAAATATLPPPTPRRAPFFARARALLSGSAI